jgi:peroxiredoxin
MFRTIILLAVGANLLAQGYRLPEESRARRGSGQGTRRVEQESPLKPETRAIIDAFAARLDEYRDARREYTDAGNDPAGFVFDMSKDILAVKEKQNEADEPEALQALLVAEGALKLRGGEFLEPELLDSLAKNVPSDFAGWYLDGRLLDRVADHCGSEEAILAYVEKGAMASPLPRIRRRMLAKMVAVAMNCGDGQKARAAYNAMEKEFFGTRDFIAATQKWMPFVRTFPGRPAPQLNLEIFGSPGQHLDIKSFRGRHVLVLFWASDSPGCIEQLPHLQEAWDAFGGRSLAMVSVSFDKQAEALDKFRKDSDISMPWSHCLAPGGLEGSVASAWGVAELPKNVLIGPDGEISSVGSPLSKERLLGTLRERLGE